LKGKTNNLGVIYLEKVKKNMFVEDNFVTWKDGLIP
jgi:hypothetical protein